MAMAVEAPARDRLEWMGLMALVGCAAALQFSIAAAQILLTVTLVCWAALLAIRHERPQWPVPFRPLVVYAGLTLVSAACSIDPRTSFIDSKQLVLYLLVPTVYFYARGTRAGTLIDVTITAGAVSAAFGIVQYGLLEYNNLGQRPHGAMGHYMTYSGLLVLVTCAAAARVLFHRRDWIWPALVMPALLVALTLTFTRSAWVGACAAIALLFVLKDLRLLAALPVVLALVLVAAPAGVTSRLHSIFDLTDATNRDRIAMLDAGLSMVRDHPLTGVGPNMVERVYPQYRSAGAVEAVNPHLHNVPLQIAAERGLPALAAWLWFIIGIGLDLLRKLRHDRARFLAATALAATFGMLAAGFFEYNFGDSEFLMLLLILLTLPYAASRDEAAGAPAAGAPVERRPKP